MGVGIAEPSEVDLGDSPVAKPIPRPRWTVGRLATDLAIVAMAVPMGLGTLAPPVRGSCGMTTENLVFFAGLSYFAARASWVALVALNDAGERWLQALERSRR